MNVKFSFSIEHEKVKSFTIEKVDIKGVFYFGEIF